SNFAKNNKYESIHNLGYWEYKEYLGVGCGAVGRIGDKRYYKPKSIEDYIQNPSAKEYEYLSDEDIKTEKVLLGLRSRVGVDVNVLNMQEKAKLKELEYAKKITIIDEKFYNNDYLLADEIALYLL
ncbi:MAG: coproporphyrinogen III oxidase family protein, partial [Arcobacteraceae bacterium]